MAIKLTLAQAKKIPALKNESLKIKNENKNKQELDAGAQLLINAFKALL